MQQSRNFRPLIAFLVIIVILIGVGALVLKLSQPRLTLTLAKPFNPVEDSVMIGKTKAYPSGAGGLNISANTGAGDQIITISGPLIVTKRLTVQASYFKTAQASATVEPRTIADIFLSVTSKPADTTTTRLFDDDLIIGTASAQTIPDGDKPVTVLYFNRSTQTWQNKSGSFLSDLATIQPSTNARNYYDELSAD